MKRNVRIILLSLLMLSVFDSFSYSQGIKATFTPTARQFAGFGNVVVGQSKIQKIRIYNDSASPGDLVCNLILQPGAGFTVSGYLNFSVPPGQADTLFVQFLPTATGTFHDTLVITHNGDTSTTLKNPTRYVLSGTGTGPDTFPKVSLTSPGGVATFINFGTATVGKTLSKTIVIKNITDTIRTLTGSMGKPFTRQFSIPSGSGAFSLDTGKSLTVTINFSPDTVSQILIDSLILVTNAASPNNRIKITLFGSAAKPTPFPKIAVGGFFGNVNFRTDTIGHPPRTASFIITNTSDSTRTLTGNVSSPNAPFSIVSGGGAFTLDSGKSATVQLAFTAASVGTFNDTIIVTSNADPASPPLKVPLTGIGYAVTGPHLVIQTNVVNFGTNKSGASIAGQTIKFKNNADTPQDILTGSVTPPSSPYSLTSGSGSFSLSNDDSVLITVQMASANAGSFQDSVVITSNSNDVAKRTVIHIIGSIAAQGGVSEIPESANLITAVPNPFTKRTAVRFSLEEASPVAMKIYNILGKEVFHSPEKIFPAGTGEIEWDASNLGGGAYLCVLTIGKEARTTRIILSK